MKILYKIQLALITTSIFFSCANTQNTMTNTEIVSQEEVGEIHEHADFDQSEMFSNIAQDDSLFASIKRGYCFGTCPVYNMNIYNDGTVVLEGIKFLEPIGKHTITISKEKMMRFIHVAKDINYVNLEDNYDDKNVTDLPTAITSIVLDGIRKQVRCRYRCPADLKAFEKLFDQLLETEDWGVSKEEK